MSNGVSENAKGKKLIVDIDQCTGCNCCAIACSYVKWGFYDPDGGCIFNVKMEEHGMDCPLVCQQCETPRCVESCLFKALSRRVEDGMVVVDHAKCVACGMCLTACPYGAIGPAPVGNSKGFAIMKCDQCGGTPECVQWCDTHALKYVDASEKTLIDAASENMLLAKKRYEVDFKCNIWKQRLHGTNLRKRRQEVAK